MTNAAVVRVKLPTHVRDPDNECKGGDLAPTEAALTAIFGQVAEKPVFQELQDNRRLESKQVVIDHIEKSFDN